jgi:hypothetical protein
MTFSKKFLLCLTGIFLIVLFGLAGLVGASNIFSVSITPNSVWEGTTNFFNLTITNSGGNESIITEVNLTLNNFTILTVQCPTGFTRTNNSNQFSCSNGSISYPGSATIIFSAIAIPVNSDINDTWNITTKNKNNEINSTLQNITILNDTQAPILGSYWPINGTEVKGSSSELFYIIASDNQSGLKEGILTWCVTNTIAICTVSSNQTSLTINADNLSATIDASNSTLYLDNYWTNFYFNITDNAGNYNDTNSVIGDWYHVKINRPPTLTFVSPTPTQNNYTNRTWVFINITSDYNLSQALLEWSNSSGIYNIPMSNSSPTNWWINLTNLTDGTYNYTVWGNKTTGIWNKTETRNITIDTIPPNISSVAITGYNSGFFSPNGDGQYDNVTIVVNASEPVDWVSIIIRKIDNYTIYKRYQPISEDNTTSWNKTWNGTLTNPSGQIIEGVYQIEVNIKDLAGNVNDTIVLPNNITLDNTAPTINLISPTNNTWSNSSNINFIFNFTDALSPNASCSLYINGSLNQTNNSVINGSETIFSVSGLGEGAHSWYINCTDLAGNTKQSEKRTINIDTIAPQIAFISPTPANGASQTAKTFVINVSHNESNPAWLLIYLNSNLVWNGSYNGSNGFTNWTTPTLADGNYNYQVCANDSAGNQNCTEIRTIKIYTQSGGGGGYSSLNYYLCIENWSCSDWSDCVNGIQTRNCTDQNRCGTEYNKPSTTTSCVVPESRPEAPQIQICIQGEKRCNNGNVEVCSSDGVWQLAEICANGCENNQCLPKQEISLTGQFIGREPLLTSILTGLLIVIAAGLIHIWRSRPFRYRYSL